MLAMKYLSPDSLTLVLAYIAYYKPNFLSGRCLSASHLHTLNQRLGQPHLQVRSARSQPLLAIHLALAHAGRLVNIAEGHWQISLEALPWLEATRTVQLAHLLETLAIEPQWAESLATLSLQDLFTVDFLAYIRQQLARQQKSEKPAIEKAVWLSNTDTNDWRLRLPKQIPPYQLFHLWQMGNIDENNIWQGTPFSIARAAQKGYSLTFISSFLIRLTDEPLKAHRQNELVEWYQRHNAYRVRGGYVLSVSQPAQLDEIMAQQRWRPHIGERLSSRHAFVSPSLLPLLARRLETTGYPLESSWILSKNASQATQTDSETHFLALEVLHGLRKMLELPFSIPTDGIDQFREQLSLAQQADLELKAKKILDGVRQAIRGKDAYFLPEKEPDPALIEVISAAIAQEHIIEIAYQALGEISPRLRQVEPYWLEKRDSGLYLHGYCSLAEDNRIFRLDRVHGWRYPVNLP